MLRKIINLDHETKIIYELFDNTHELVSTLSQRSLNDAYRGSRRTSEDLSKSWNGVDTMEEAHNLLYYGWKQKINLFKEKVKQNSAKYVYHSKPRLIADYVGGAPIVANAIMGLPMAMVGTKYKPKRNKIIHILLDCGLSAMYSVDDIIEWGSKNVAIINRLEQEGYSCRVEIMYNFGERNGRQQQILRFKVKEEGHPIDLQRFTFPVANPAMFRAIGFDWEETLPEGKRISGKGNPLHSYEEQRRENIIKAITNNEGLVVYANIKTNLEEQLKKKVGWEM